MGDFGLTWVRMGESRILGGLGFARNQTRGCGDLKSRWQIVIQGLLFR